MPWLNCCVNATGRSRTRRRVTVRKFKRTILVDIREYYEKNGVQLPGKKGISMNIEQFEAFVGLIPEIRKQIQELES